MLPTGGSYKYVECMAYISLIVFRMISFHKRKIRIQKDSKDIAVRELCYNKAIVHTDQACRLLIIIMSDAGHILKLAQQTNDWNLEPRSSVTCDPMTCGR